MRGVINCTRIHCTRILAPFPASQQQWSSQSPIRTVEHHLQMLSQSLSDLCKILQDRVRGAMGREESGRYGA